RRGDRGPPVLPPGRRLDVPCTTLQHCRRLCRRVGRAVSEYQYYEFVAIDRPLDDAELSEVRSLSTRARITATGFANEYHWGDLSAAQRALADFLRIDDDLLAIAAQTSPPLQETTGEPGDVAAWVARLPVAEKDRLLTRVVQGEAARVQMELLRRFRADTAPT